MARACDVKRENRSGRQRFGGPPRRDKCCRGRALRARATARHPAERHPALHRSRALYGVRWRYVRHHGVALDERDANSCMAGLAASTAIHSYEAVAHLRPCGKRSRSACDSVRARQPTVGSPCRTTRSGRAFAARRLFSSARKHHDPRQRLGVLVARSGGNRPRGSRGREFRTPRRPSPAFARCRIHASVAAGTHRIVWRVSASLAGLGPRHHRGQPATVARTDVGNRQDPSHRRLRRAADSCVWKPGAAAAPPVGSRRPLFAVRCLRRAHL